MQESHEPILTTSYCFADAVPLRRAVELVGDRCKIVCESLLGCSVHPIALRTSMVVRSVYSHEVGKTERIPCQRTVRYI